MRKDGGKEKKAAERGDNPKKLTKETSPRPIMSLLCFNLIISLKKESEPLKTVLMRFNYFDCTYNRSTEREAEEMREPEVSGTMSGITEVFTGRESPAARFYRE